MCIDHGYSSLCGHHTNTPINCGQFNCTQERLWSTKTHCDACWSYLTALQLSTATETEERNRFKHILLQLRERDKVLLERQFHDEESIRRRGLWGGGFAYNGPLEGIVGVGLGWENPRFNEELCGYYELEKQAEERRFIELIEIARRDKLLESEAYLNEKAMIEAAQRSLQNEEIRKEVMRLQQSIDDAEKQQRQEEAVRLIGERRRKQEILKREFEDRTKERKKVLARLLGIDERDDERLEGYLPIAYPEDYPRDWVKQKKIDEWVAESKDKRAGIVREKKRSPDFKPMDLDNSSSNSSDSGGDDGSGKGRWKVGGGKYNTPAIRYIRAVDQNNENYMGPPPAPPLSPVTGVPTHLPNLDGILGGWHPRNPPPAVSSTSSSSGHTSDTSVVSDTTDIYDPAITQLADNFTRNLRKRVLRKKSLGRNVPRSVLLIERKSRMKRRGCGRNSGKKMDGKLKRG